MTPTLRRILIVDDNEEDRAYTKRLLRKAREWDWQFAEAFNGEQGLALAASSGPFDCILLDYRLPDMDGIEFLKRLRERIGEPDPVTVVLTAMGDESVAVKAIRSGAEDYFAKSKLNSGLLVQALDGAMIRFQQSVAELRAESERKQAAIKLQELSQQLAKALAEKTILLKEVHHRVKNNFAIVSSLLGMQSQAVNNAEAASALLECENRLRSMALIHEHLYTSEDFGRLRFDEYAQQLAGQISDSFSAPGRIRIRVEAGPVELIIDKAISCGLILNELVTNAFKYAFPADMAGEIVISLVDLPGDRLTLSVADDGRGIPDTLDWREAKSLGLKIVQILAAQLGGTLELSSGTGTRFAITFSSVGEADKEL